MKNEANRVKKLRDALDEAVLAGDVSILESLFADPESLPGFVSMEEILGLAEGTLTGAVVNGELEIVEFLVGIGVSPDARDKNNDGAALHYCADWGQPDIARFLLNAGADIDLRDRRSGNVPLLTAIANRKQNPEVMEVLLEFGPDLSLENSAGVSPNSIAKVLDLDLTPGRSDT